MLSDVALWLSWLSDLWRKNVKFLCFFAGAQANLPPYFTDDMNNHVISENTPVGTAVYTLKAIDPEGLPLRYGIMGTDKLTVDDRTGIVTISKPIDREVSLKNIIFNYWVNAICK